MKNRPFPSSRRVLAALLGSAACAAVVPPAHAASPVVPWLAQTADAPVTENADTAVVPATRPCGASDLRVAVGAAGAWHGFATQEILLSRTGPGTDRCFLDGAPALELVSDTGVRQAVEGSTSMSARRRLELGPHDDAHVLVGTPGACDAATGEERRVATRLRALLPGGGDALLAGVHVDTLCGAARVLRAEAIEDEAHQAQAASTSARAPWHALEASLDGVAPAVAGGTLRYVVTLANAGDAAVPLAPCPAYTQSLHVEGRTVETHWRLACAAAGAQVPAHGRVSFAMEAAVPATMAGPGVKLAWTLEDGPSAGAIVPLQ